jgi:hypothetical protein
MCTMTWNAFHRRGEILRDVVALAEQRRDGRLPAQLPDGTDLFPDVFADELDLLGALWLRWHARLSANLDRALGRQPIDREAAVAAAWARTADECPGLRLVLDQYAARPADQRMAQALRRAQHKEHARLAAAAGLASDEGSAAAEAGRRIELAARAGRRTPVPSPRPAPAERPAAQCSLVDRIKAALVA